MLIPDLREVPLAAGNAGSGERLEAALLDVLGFAGDRADAALAAWTPDLPGYGFVTGMHAFALKEGGCSGEAEAPHEAREHPGAA